MESILHNSLGSGDYMLQKQIEIMIETNHKKLKAELDGIKSMLSELSESVREIKRGLRDGRIEAGGEPSHDARAHEVREEPASLRETCVRETIREPVRESVRVSSSLNQDKPKPRYGDYTSDDVSITKFFYCGGGKR